MLPDYYTNSFDLSKPSLSTLVLDACIGMGQGLSDSEVSPDYREAREMLSRMLFGLSEVEEGNHYFYFSETLLLANFYWPSETEPNQNLKGKNDEDVRLQTWLLAKDIETYQELSKERQKKLMEICLDLKREIDYNQNELYKRRFAA